MFFSVVIVVQAPLCFDMSSVS